MSGARVAIACCRRSGDAGPTDLYPDPDAAPLQAAFSELGAHSRLVAWDDPVVEWGSFSHVLVSSTWDSVDRPGDYLAWVKRVAALSTLVNPERVITWNLDKTHQQDLAKAGVPVIPTTWVRPGNFLAALPATEFVVKPSVSAGGRGTARYAPGDPAALGHVESLHELGQTVMVQEYCSRIDEEGEVDLIFVNGACTHAVLKRPALSTGEGVVERPWERMAWAGRVAPLPDQLAVANRTIEAVAEGVGCMPVYGRVDLVGGHSGEPLVLEVELIDPYLSFDMEPSAAGHLATAILHR
ncbi:MAG TPA: hypothetical protein VFN61_11465 [Acidimicrobiales bacterium]|nr:hypothetical protein [Acidimicrobiales bacterium]